MTPRSFFRFSAALLCLAAANAHAAPIDCAALQTQLTGFCANNASDPKCVHPESFQANCKNYIKAQKNCQAQTKAVNTDCAGEKPDAPSAKCIVAKKNYIACVRVYFPAK